MAILLGSGAAHADEAPARPPLPAGAKQLDPRVPVWVADGAVYADAEVCLREGVLEMFACPAGTKEHESVVVVLSPAFLLHTGLLAVGAEPGSPVRFDPEYRPPTGTEIAVTVHWLADGKVKSVPAQNWVKNTKTGRQMELPFVFAGSGFWTDPDSGQQYYLAESGDLICVSNFGAAMLDVPARSTQTNGELWFEPFTQRIPPRRTPLRLELRPKAEAQPVNAAKSNSSCDLAEALQTLRSAAPGAGSNAEIQSAWSQVASSSADCVPTVLRAMTGASALAENWLRTAADAIVDARGVGRLPAGDLRGLVQDTEQSPRARRTAFEYIRRMEPQVAAAMLDDLVDDPSEEIRYDAVERLLARAGDSSEEEQPALYRRALFAARTLDQIETAVEALGELGIESDFASELGFIRDWRVVGPFDNRDGVGFAKAYPPEQSLDLVATYEGFDEDGPQGPFGWKTYRTEDRQAEVELNDGIGRHKGAVGYAWAVIEVDDACDAEVRYESRAATKVWVNGDEVATNEVYHSGSLFDQYVAPTRLNAGSNVILMKACQNQQTQPWAQTWSFTLRVTGPAGAPIEGLSVIAPPATAEGG